MAWQYPLCGKKRKKVLDETREPLDWDSNCPFCNQKQSGANIPLWWHFAEKDEDCQCTQELFACGISKTIHNDLCSSCFTQNICCLAGSHPAFKVTGKRSLEVPSFLSGWRSMCQKCNDFGDTKVWILTGEKWLGTDLESLFIRNCYESIKTEIWSHGDEFSSEDLATLIIGTSGIGKSTFLPYFATCCLQKAASERKSISFLYGPRGQDCWILQSDGNVSPAGSGGTFDYIIYDDRDNDTKYSAKCALLVSFEKGGVYDRFQKDRNPTIDFMPVWSKNEWEECCRELRLTNSAAASACLFTIFGGSIRHLRSVFVFKPSSSSVVLDFVDQAFSLFFPGSFDAELRRRILFYISGLLLLIAAQNSSSGNSQLSLLWHLHLSSNDDIDDVVAGSSGKVSIRFASRFMGFLAASILELEDGSMREVLKKALGQSASGGLFEYAGHKAFLTANSPEFQLKALNYKGGHRKSRTLSACPQEPKKIS